MKRLFGILAVAMVLGMGIVGCHAEGDVHGTTSNVSGIR